MLHLFLNEHFRIHRELQLALPILVPFRAILCPSFKALVRLVTNWYQLRFRWLLPRRCLNQGHLKFQRCPSICPVFVLMFPRILVYDNLGTLRPILMVLPAPMWLSVREHCLHESRQWYHKNSTSRLISSEPLVTGCQLWTEKSARLTVHPFIINVNDSYIWRSKLKRRLDCIQVHLR